MTIRISIVRDEAGYWSVSVSVDGRPTVMRQCGRDLADALAMADAILRGEAA